MRYTFAGKSKVIDIRDSAILEDIKAYLRGGDRLVILEFTNKEDKSKENSRTDRKNNSNKKNNSKKGSRIDRENNSKDKNN